MENQVFMVISLISLGLLTTTLIVILYVQFHYPRKKYMPLVGFNVLSVVIIGLELLSLVLLRTAGEGNVLKPVNILQEYILCLFYPLIPYLIEKLFDLSPRWRGINRDFEVLGQGLVVFFVVFLLLFPDQFLTSPPPGYGTTYYARMGVLDVGFGILIRDGFFILFLGYLMISTLGQFKRSRSNPNRGTPLLLGLIFGIIFSVLAIVKTWGQVYGWRAIPDIPFINLGLTLFNIFAMLFFLHFFFHRAREYEETSRILKEQKDSLYQMAYRDDLTDLPNRKSFLMELQRVISSRDDLYGVYLIDLDNFLDINESYGYKAGDHILQQVTRGLNEMAHQSGGKLFRIAGDEFGYISPRLLNKQEAIFFADDLMRVFEKSVSHGDNLLYLTVSIGAGVYPEDGSTIEAVTKSLGSAMAEAKQERNRYCFYSSSLKERSRERVGMISALRDSLKKEGLRVHYQPIMDASGNVASAEALIRWYHPDWGSVSPAVFIPLAESSGLIIPLSEMVIQQVMGDVKEMDARGFPLRFSINLSAKQLKEENLCRKIKDYLNKNNIGLDRISFELTETALIENLEESRYLLDCFRSAGFGISIDDFGKGYSSLNYLRVLPIEKLKIDKCFVDVIPGDPKDEALITSIIQLAKTLQLKVVAEGIEKQSQYDFLKNAGCDYFQGYLFSEALPLEGLLEVIDKGTGG